MPRLGQAIAAPYIGERRPRVGVPRGFLQVDDVRSALAGRGQCRDPEGMDGDIRGEPELADDNKPTHQERLTLKNILKSERPGGRSPNKDGEAEGAEDSCPTFGFLRGANDSATDLEFRFKDGTSIFYPYRLMGTWRYNPSVGILLKFNGDVASLVLIKDCNLDAPLSEGSINLTRGGLQRNRVLWIREMAKDDIRQVGDTGPTIDSIEIAEFESRAALKEWVSKKAPAFGQ